MARTPTIALDAMGGDHGPAVIVSAADIARVRAPNVRFLLIGDAARIETELVKFPALRLISEIIHTDDAVAGSEKPSKALRRIKTTSMGLAVQAVKDGRADAAVSAGNTGALMATAKFVLRTMPGIHRPALASLLPTVRAECVMLDLGANTECDADNLVEFALMGAAFARTTLGLARPRVALLNIGVEEMKGTGELKDAAARLHALQDMSLDFVGFTEGDKIASGDIDVIVTDGFSGNIALKTAEGTAKLVGTLLRQSLSASIWGKIGYLFASGALRNLRNHLDPNNHNGAVFLGLNGLVVKSHGSASDSGFASAIDVARELVADKLDERIAHDMLKLQAQAAKTVAAKTEVNVPDADAA
jgi:phosphate acyltransferase